MKNGKGFFILLGLIYMDDSDPNQWKIEEYRQASEALRYANRQIHLSLYLYCFLLLGFSQVYISSISSSIFFRISIIILAVALLSLLNLNAYAEIKERDILKIRQHDIEKNMDLDVHSEAEDNMEPGKADNIAERFVFMIRNFHMAHGMFIISTLWVSSTSFILIFGINLN